MLLRFCTLLGSEISCSKLALLVCLCNVSSREHQCKNFSSHGDWHELTFCVMTGWLSIVIICWLWLSLFTSEFDASLVVVLTTPEFGGFSRIVVLLSGPSYVVSFCGLVVFLFSILVLFFFFNGVHACLVFCIFVFILFSMYDTYDERWY